jgi:asparagine synthase (glutamine-hydrolysing)
MKRELLPDGFLTARNLDNDIKEIVKKSVENHPASEIFEKDNIILATTNRQARSGMWKTESGAVCYDIDLTNIAELCKLSDMSMNDTIDSGYMIWKLYNSYGLEFLNILRGQFRLTIWAEKNDELIVATDPYGIKPVVYKLSGNRFIAADRIKNLLTGMTGPPEISPNSIYQYLYFSVIPSPFTIYKGIRKLEPGNCIIFKEGKFSITTYYDIHYKPYYSAPMEYWLNRIPEEIETAVKKSISASGHDRIGCFLSGGTDSSTIVGYCDKLIGSNVKTFSIGFHDKDYNELEYAHIASRHFRTAQFDYYVKPKDVLALVEMLPSFYDEPFGNSSVVPAYFCAKMAKQNDIDILLGGDGGDEIFGGNERYATNLLFESYFKIPEFMRKYVIEALLERVPDSSILYRMKRYVRRANIKNPERFFSYNLLAEETAADLFTGHTLSQIDTDCFMNLARTHYQNKEDTHDTDKLLYIDMKFTITDNDLPKVTRMCEAADIDVRYPLLDRDLVDFTATIPPGTKVRLFKNRYIFKKAMQGFLPEEIIKKKKHGMGLPIALWFKTDKSLSELLNDVLFFQKPFISEYIKIEYLKKMKHLFEQDQTTFYGSNLWVFLMLELFLRNLEN